MDIYICTRTVIIYRNTFIEHVMASILLMNFIDVNYSVLPIYSVKEKRSKLKIEKFLFNTHSHGSIIYPTCKYSVVPIAQCIAVQSCWINAASLMCVTI